MSNNNLGKIFTAFNSILDTRAAEAIGLRKLVERITYQGAYNGVNISKKASRVFGGTAKQTKAERPEVHKKSDLFDLSLTDDQEMVRQTIQQFAAQYLRNSAENSNDNCAVPEEVVKEFRALGLPFYSVPEALGGVLAERSTVTQMIITEEMAYGDPGMAVALLSPIGALNALVAWGTAAQQEKYIPAFLDEANPISAAIAVNEPSALFDPFHLDTKAIKTDSGYILNGRKATVPLVSSSELFLVAADIEGEGPGVFIVESGFEGVSVSAANSMGLRPAALGELELKNVKVPATARLGDQLNYRHFIDHSRIGWCALAVGTTRAVLDYVIEYCNQRVAFGEPITHRQAVAFMIANIRIESDAMQVLTQRAASKAEQGLDFSRDAYLASVLCGEKSMEIGNNGVQLLGGYGFMRDYPAERWYRDLRSVAICYNGLHI